MTKSLQEIAEEKAYDILFELEDEFNLKTGSLPEIHYITKKFSFEKMGLDYGYYDSFYRTKITKDPVYIPSENIILLGSFKKSHIAEEILHSIHYGNLNYDKNVLDEFAAETISEMLGYFCSKLIDEKRKTAFWGDSLLHKKSVPQILNGIKFIMKKGELDNLVHQQGYSLGDKLYYAYLEGKVSKDKIKKTIENPLPERYEAFSEFMHWKYEVLA